MVQKSGTCKFSAPDSARQGGTGVEKRPGMGELVVGATPCLHHPEEGHPLGSLSRGLPALFDGAEVSLREQCWCD